MNIDDYLNGIQQDLDNRLTRFGLNGLQTGIRSCTLMRDYFTYRAEDPRGVLRRVRQSNVKNFVLKNDDYALFKV